MFANTSPKAMKTAVILISGRGSNMLTLLDANGRELTSDDDGGEEQLASRLEVPAAHRHLS